MQQLKGIHLSLSHSFTKILSILFFSFCGLTLLAYVLPFVPREELHAFHSHISKSVLILFLIASIIIRIKAAQKSIESIFWYVFCSAFTFWFILHLLQSLGSELFSKPQVDISIDFVKFLFYSLVIASIEIKSYKQANELLDKQNVVIGLSSLLFSVGAFVYFVLIPTQSTNTEQLLHNPSYAYYIVMDLYIAFRWLMLTLRGEPEKKLAYLAFGLAIASLALTDSLEAAHNYGAITSDKGGLLELINYLPYLLMFIAIHILVPKALLKPSGKYLYREYILNHPLFFIALFALIHTIFSQYNYFPVSYHSAQIVVLLIFGCLLLMLAASQIYFLHQSSKDTQNEIRFLQQNISITEQQLEKQVLLAIEKTESHQAILESTNNAIITVNETGMISSCNPATYRLLGYKESDLVNTPFKSLIESNEELSRFFEYQSYRQELDRNPQGLERDSIAISKFGEKLDVHVTFSKFLSSSRQHFVISMADISEQKRAEIEAHRIKDQFIANMSHEFRTPLTIINGVIDNLHKTRNLSEDVQSQLETAKRNCMRLIRMVEQLLEFSHLSDNSLTLSIFDINHSISFVCESFDAIAKENNIQFEHHIKDNTWILANSQAFEKILFNLLSNAFKYSPSGSRVSISISEEDDQYHLKVCDTGIGIPKSEQENIFERFHRVNHPHSKNVHGVGIGLSLVKELVDLHRWKIGIESEPDMGTEFTLIIPKAAPLPIEDEKVQQDSHHASLDNKLDSELIDAQYQAKAEKDRNEKYSVLVIEDNYDMQSHLKSILSPNHHCLFADTGEEGIELSLNYIPDIIISDVMLPGISGFDALRTIRQTEMTEHIPVIMLTARSDLDSKLEGLEAEADDYLAKPFDGRELLLRIQNQINSRLKFQSKLNKTWQSIDPKTILKEQVEDSKELKFLNKMNEFIDIHYQNTDFSMSQLSAELAVSERQLQRKVKAILGISPTEVLKKFRLKKSREELLRNTQVGLVAQTCGFSSQTYFGRCFKEEFGMSPKEYQKVHSSKSES